MFSSKRVRTISQFASLINNRAVFYFGIPAAEHESTLLKIGFVTPLEAGQVLLPIAMGRISDFNANGKEKIRRDLPMIPKVFHQYRTWTDWHGHSHSGFVFQTRSVYPRDYIEAPEVCLTLMKSKDGSLVLLSQKMTSAEDEAQLIHVANLFLELFGKFDVYGETIEPALTYKKLNWEILPAGTYPWDRVRATINERLLRKSDSQKAVITQRNSHIAKFNPNFIASGSAGFGGYFVYGFPKKNFYLLECPDFGNATYVLGNDWERIAQLTKREIIQNSLYERRIIHGQDWEQRIVTLLQ
ncbi:MAG: hypothetical protein QM533_08835 [Cytophagales bacterium]|nr:hypothetical protein [Cytophagales bacterium]